MFKSYKLSFLAHEKHAIICVLFVPFLVCEVVQSLQLSTGRNSLDVVGELSVCLDGMQVHPEALAQAESEQGKEGILYENSVKKNQNMKTTQI